MTHQNDTAREAARANDGRFGAQKHTAPEFALPGLSKHAPHGTYEILPDDINGGDTLLIDGKPHLVHETWTLGIEPETRIAETNRGDIRLDREELVSIVRTGNESKPEDDPDYAGICHRCGQEFSEDHNHVTSHIHPRGGRDYNADENHTPYSLDDEL